MAQMMLPLEGGEDKGYRWLYAYEDLSDAIDELDVMVKELDDELEMVKDRVARIRRHLRTVISYILEEKMGGSHGH